MDSARLGVCFRKAAARSLGCGGATAAFGEIALVRAGCPAPAQSSDWPGSTFKSEICPKFPCFTPPLQLLQWLRK